MTAPMATRAVSGGAVLGLLHLRPLTHSRTLRFPNQSTSIWCGNLTFRYVGGDQTRFSHSLVDLVMEELRASKRTRASAKVGLTSTKELAQSELKKEKGVLRKGLLLEFEKDSKKIVLAVAHRPDGKKNWIVYDQNGIRSSIKPQQITYIVPGIEDFEQSDIAEFAKKAQALMDPTILECAWLELLEKNQWVTVEQVAEIIYGGSSPLESYCTYVLLSRDELYFDKIQTRDSLGYEPRCTDKVDEILRGKMIKEAAKKELEEFVETLVSAKSMPHCSKPPKNTWLIEAKVRQRIESLAAFATDTCKNDDQRKTAEIILKEMGMPKIPSTVVRLLIDIGYFPVHVNLDIYKYNLRTTHNYKSLLAAEQILTRSSDCDEHIRKDLTSLKVYAIDVDEADELDDALSATRLSDGRIKVWIHVADPTCLVEPGGTIDKEAMHRGTSVYLPTETFSMFPEKLAMEAMSLRQGEICKAVSVSVVLDPDGRIGEYTVENTEIKPTYMLTYESASELLYLNLPEESELTLLYQAASLRSKFRRDQGAIDTGTLEPRIKVLDPDSADPTIKLYVENRDGPANQMVTEMMILCGEVISRFGSANQIPLPYRGQSLPNIDDESLSLLPAGPVRCSAYLRLMRPAELDFRAPLRHDTLGVDGYVQFTSPIRRYVDLLAHFQVKAYIRGEKLPFGASELEARTFIANMHIKVAKRLQNSSLRYWLLEYMRRQPKEKTFLALILRFVKDRLANLLLVEVGIQVSCKVSDECSVGDHIRVRVLESHPRRDIFTVTEV